MPTLGRGYGKSLETMEDVMLQFKFKFSHNDEEDEEILAANLKKTFSMMEVWTSSQDQSLVVSVINEIGMIHANDVMPCQFISQ